MDFKKQAEYGDFILKAVEDSNMYLDHGVSFPDYLMAFYRTSYLKIKVLPSPHCYNCDFIKEFKNNSIMIYPSSGDEVNSGRGLWQIFYQFSPALHAQFGLHCDYTESGKLSTHLTALVAFKEREDLQTFFKMTEPFQKREDEKTVAGFAGLVN